MVNNFIWGDLKNMRKLKVALTLLFAMCFSLFLFACGGGKSGLKSVLVEGDIKTTYAETDTAKAFSIDGMVVKVIYKEGMKTDDNGNVIPVELKGSEYTVDASAIKWGTVGTYPVIVTPNGQKEVDPSLTQEVVGTYEVKIEHAYGEADENGEKVCSVCEARIRNVTVDDTVEIKKWGGAPAVEKKNDKSPITQPKHYATYGNIGIGQRITVRGTALNTNLSADWFFPIIGVANGTKGVVVRNDSWTILEGPGADFYWPNHNTGATASGGNADATSAEWDIFANGTTCTSRDYVPEAQMELTWNYREDGIMQLIFNNITAGKKVTYELKVPAASYDAVLYGEHVKMHITEVEIEKNLSIKNFEVLHGANKLAYAENTLFNEDGIVTKATYNKGIVADITTYDLYADIVTGEGDEKVTTTYDLRTTPLTKNMTNFRLEFSGYSKALPIELTESVIRGVNPDWDVQENRYSWHADDVNYVYDVNENKEITIFASGTASKVPDGKGDPNSKYYISFRLMGCGKNVKDQTYTFQNGTTVGQVVWENGNGEALIMVDADSEGKIAPVDITLKEQVSETETIDRVIKLDTTNLTIPAVSSVQSGKAYIDVGGEIEVTFEGAALKEDISTYTFFAGSKRLSYNDLNKLNAAENPASEVVAIRDSLVITKFAHNKTDGTLIITYKLLAPNLARAFTNSFNVSVQKDGETLADETLVYAYEMSSALGGGYVEVSNGLYVKADGTRLIALRFNNSINVEADFISDVKLNIQNDSATVYDLSVKIAAGNVAQFTAVNDLTKVTLASARVNILGTVGYAEDYDRGAAIISVVDLTAIGLRNTTDTKTQTYYFEAYKTDLSSGYDIYKVENNTITKETVATPTERTGGVLGDCVLDTLRYYELKDGGTVLFKYGQQASVAHGNHNFVDDVCSKCGTRKVAAPTAGMQFAKLDEAVFTESDNGNIVSRGLTVSFNGENSDSDWNSVILGTSANLNIALGALDPWWSTGDFASVNMYPGLVGAEANVLYNIKGYFTVTISVETGVTYYVDGTKKLQYPASKEMGTKTVGAFVEAFLTEVAENGFTFLPNSHDGLQNITSPSKLSIVTKAMTGDEVYAYCRNENAQGTVRVINQSIGSELYTNAWHEANYDLGDLTSGSKMIVYGKQLTAGTDNWKTVLARLNGEYVVRGDNFSFIHDLPNQDNSANRLEITPKVQFKVTPEDKANADVWVDFKNIAKDGWWEVVYDWTDATKITIAITFWNSELKYEQSYELTPKSGKSFAASYYAALNCEGSYVTIMAMETIKPASAN